MSVSLHNQALLEELRRQRDQASDQLAMCRAELAVSQARLKALEDRVAEASESTEDSAS